jgi:hypothetical protein
LYFRIFFKNRSAKGTECREGIVKAQFIMFMPENNCLAELISGSARFLSYGFGEKMTV